MGGRGRGRLDGRKQHFSLSLSRCNGPELANARPPQNEMELEMVLRNFLQVINPSSCGMGGGRVAGWWSGSHMSGYM